jgi:hypothetical protein
MLFSGKCCSEAQNCFRVVSQFNNFKSYLGCLLHSRNLVVGSKPLCKPYSYVTNLSKCGYCKYSGYILMPHIQEYIKNSRSMSTQSVKTKGNTSPEPQGIHENVSALQTRTRLQRRKRPPLEEEDSRKLGVW